MGRKSYTIESEIKLHMICVPRCNICPNDHIYLNIELFGETQRSKLMHPVFPIKTNETFYFNKTFWSPQNVKEMHKLMRDSPVSIELRHLKTGSRDSNLLAFADSDSYRFLFDGCKNQSKDVMVADRHIDLTQTGHHCGQLPCVKMEIRSTLSTTETPVIDKLLCDDTDLCPHCDKFHFKKSQVAHGGCSVRGHCDMYKCVCELHRDPKDQWSHCSVCHQDQLKSQCTHCVTRVTGDHLSDSDSEHEVTEIPGKMRPPFVVRKLDTSIVARIPDAYDSVFNGIMREQTQLRSSRKKKLHRLRSCSPKADKKDKRSPSRKSPSKASEVCYACNLPPNEVRISCDSCNLTYRGEPSYRCGDLIRPEPPMLRTRRETVDQKPLYPISDIKCSNCIRKKVTKPKDNHDDCLLVSTRPIYKLDGYRDMEKYFPRLDSREY